MRKLILLFLIFTAISCQQKEFKICEFKGKTVVYKDYNHNIFNSYYLYFEDSCSYQKIKVPEYYYRKYEKGDEIGKMPRMEQDAKRVDSIISSLYK